MVKIAETKFIAYSDNKINNLLKIRHGLLAYLMDM
jgi:hypothetical protein